MATKLEEEFAKMTPEQQKKAREAISGQMGMPKKKTIVKEKKKQKTAEEFEWVSYEEMLKRKEKKKQKEKHSGFEAPVIGTVFPEGTTFKTNENGRIIPIPPNKK